MPKNIELIDFFAPWCGPCRMMAPIMEAIEKEYKSKINFTNINIDEDQEKANHYQISSIPTILIVKNNKVVSQLTGPKTKDTIIDAIESAIK